MRLPRVSCCTRADEAAQGCFAAVHPIKVRDLLGRDSYSCCASSMGDAAAMVVGALNDGRRPALLLSKGGDADAGTADAEAAVHKIKYQVDEMFSTHASGSLFGLGHAEGGQIGCPDTARGCLTRAGTTVRVRQRRWDRPWI